MTYSQLAATCSIMLLLYVNLDLQGKPNPEKGFILRNRLVLAVELQSFAPFVFVFLKSGLTHAQCRVAVLGFCVNISCMFYTLQTFNKKKQVTP